MVGSTDIALLGIVPKRANIVHAGTLVASARLVHLSSACPARIISWPFARMRHDMLGVVFVRRVRWTRLAAEPGGALCMRNLGLDEACQLRQASKGGAARLRWSSARCRVVGVKCCAPQRRSLVEQQKHMYVVKVKGCRRHGSAVLHAQGLRRHGDPQTAPAFLFLSLDVIRCKTLCVACAHGIGYLCLPLGTNARPRQRRPERGATAFGAAAVQRLPS